VRDVEPDLTRRDGEETKTQQGAPRQATTPGAEDFLVLAHEISFGSHRVDAAAARADGEPAAERVTRGD
jgi:hypothetical protein